ncbi:MAG: hypothetical protein U5L01_17245 [Rheinheimera sp.]|nr:hypothetical protein [Rheinheimera sp.]
MVAQLNSASNDAHKVIVHKFGGSSLATAERFHAVADILLSQPQPKAVVVVSAPGDTTDHLLDLLAASENDTLFGQLHQQLSSALRLLVSRTLAPANANVALDVLSGWLDQLPTWTKKGAFNDALAVGERLSALLLSQLLLERGAEAQAIDARDFLRLDTTSDQNQEVQWQSSGELLQAQRKEGFAVITGFIARDLAGNSITLGRNGSDYSATIIGRLVQAQAIHIWTDVDAIYSADPRKVPSAKAYRQVPWSQATRLAALGNPVLHAKTLSPLQDFHAELVVRSSYEPSQPGCRVSRQSAIEVQFVTDLADVVLLSLPSQCRLLATTVANALQVAVFAAPGSHGKQWVLAQKNLEAVLTYLGQRQIYPRVSSEQFYAVAWVKPAARQQRQLSLQAAHWLERQQPAHSFQDDELALWLFNPALTAAELTELHQLLLPSTVRLNIVVAGTGNVGSEFLALLAKQQQAYAGQIELRLVGVFNSRQACLSDQLRCTALAAKLGRRPSIPKARFNRLSDRFTRSEGAGGYHAKPQFCRRLC